MVRAMDRFAPGQWGRVIFAGQGLFYGWKHVGERRANTQSLTPREAQITQNSINAQAIRTNSMKSRIIAHL